MSLNSTPGELLSGDGRSVSRTKLVWAGIILLLGVSCAALFAVVYLGHRRESPAAAEAEGPIRAYLLAKKNCSGAASVRALNISRVGTFEARLGGFPVYGTFSVQCQTKNSTETWVGKDEGAAIGFVRRNLLGNLEAFTPDVFTGMEAQINSDVEKLNQKFKEDMEKVFK